MRFVLLSVRLVSPPAVDPSVLEPIHSLSDSEVMHEGGQRESQLAWSWGHLPITQAKTIKTKVRAYVRTCVRACVCACVCVHVCVCACVHACVHELLLSLLHCLSACVHQCCSGCTIQFANSYLYLTITRTSHLGNRTKKNNRLPIVELGLL